MTDEEFLKERELPKPSDSFVEKWFKKRWAKIKPGIEFLAKFDSGELQRETKYKKIEKGILNEKESN